MTRIIAAGMLCIALSMGGASLASAQSALVVRSADGDADCSDAVVGSLQTAGFSVQVEAISPVPEGQAIDNALGALVNGHSLLIGLDLPPATFTALGVPAYGNLLCQARFSSEGGEAVLARALEIGQPIAFQAAVILYPETTAGSLALAILSGFDSLAKPSLTQLAAQVAAAGGEAAKTMVIDTRHGLIAINLRDDLAPQHTARMLELTREGFYDGVVFHRVIDGFMAQTGDPTGTGRGGSDKPDVPAEFSDPTVASFTRGIVGMARSQSPDSANSQFFIMFEDGPFLDGQYTIIGEVLVGMDAVDQIKRGAEGSGAVTNPDRMQRVFVLADEI